MPDEYGCSGPAEVLLAAGTSSPTLREVAHAGVNIQSAGYAEIAVPFITLAASLLTVCQRRFDTVYLHTAWWFCLLQFFTVGIPVALLVVLCRSTKDERCPDLFAGTRRQRLSNMCFGSDKRDLGNLGSSSCVGSTVFRVSAG